MRKFLYILGSIAFVLLVLVLVKYLTVSKIDTSKLEYVQTDTSVNLRRVKQNGKWALVDLSNRPITDFEYDSISPFIEKKSVIVKNGKYGFIDDKVNVVTPAKYDLAFDFLDGVAKVSVIGKWGLIDENGNELIKPDYYDYISSFDYKGIARAENYKDNVVVFIDKTGKKIK